MHSKKNAKPSAGTTPWPQPCWLQRGPLHRMAWREVGNPQGEPWLLLHGGPGSGCQSGLLAPFDLRRQRVLAPDQRGAGASRPRGAVAANTLGALVADLEALRQHAGIERWSLLGGSWGTVLALAYAQKHPERVERLVLRGAFRLSRREVGGLLLPGTALSKNLPTSSALWPVRPGMGLPVALARLAQLLQSGAMSVTSLQVVRGWALRELRDALHGLRRSLLHAEGAAATAPRRAWAALQRQQRRGIAALHQPRATPADRRGWAKYRVQAHYLSHAGFVRPGQLDAAVLALARHGVAVDWVHGRFDAICPPGNSARWVALGRKAGGVVRHRRPASGHLAVEVGVAEAMRECINREMVVGRLPTSRGLHGH